MPQIVSADADCARCKTPHPYRLHSEDGGPCGVFLCGCPGFEAAVSKVAALPPRCYLCDRPAHATGACPLVSHKG